MEPVVFILEVVFVELTTTSDEGMFQHGLSRVSSSEGGMKGRHILGLYKSCARRLRKKPTRKKRN